MTKINCLGGVAKSKCCFLKYGWFQVVVNRSVGKVKYQVRMKVRFHSFFRLSRPNKNK